MTVILWLPSHMILCFVLLVCLDRFTSLLANGSTASKWNLCYHWQKVLFAYGARVIQDWKSSIIWHNFSIKKMHLELSSAKCWSFLSGLDVLSTIPVQPTDFCRYFSFCPVAHTYINLSSSATHIARFMGPTWDPPGADRTQAGSMWATWTLLSGNAQILIGNNVMQPYLNMKTNYRTDKPTQTSIAYKRASTCT